MLEIVRMVKKGVILEIVRMIKKGLVRPKFHRVRGGISYVLTVKIKLAPKNP